MSELRMYEYTLHTSCCTSTNLAKEKALQDRQLWDVAKDDVWNTYSLPVRLEVRVLHLDNFGQLPSSFSRDSHLALLIDISKIIIDRLKAEINAADGKKNTYIKLIYSRNRPQTAGEGLVMSSVCLTDSNRIYYSTLDDLGGGGFGRRTDVQTDDLR